MTADIKDTSSPWTREEDKAFENALATHPEDSLDRWEKIAADVSGKTVEDVKRHFDLLAHDVNQIESGCVPLPSYRSSLGAFTGRAGNDGTRKKDGHFDHFSRETNHGGKASRSDQERRKGIAWTKDEHRQFLLGLDQYGKGDWRSISRNFVVTRTPTQVASHAQKYFIRLNSMNKDRRRLSIHDVTSVGNGDNSAPQGPITGQNNTAATGPPPGKSTKPPPPQPPAVTPGIGVYGTPAIGQPIGGPLVAAVGTPVTLPCPLHMAYGARAQAPGPVAPSGPVGTVPVSYPMPNAHAHR
ncbi:hypothetical protein Nepgr_008901 [Nepenthes gracilis]|uniref:Uncharacterized protein n=1 Tax=Nepenthes gracilis TaxID=150966 RepID=A0AAD3S9U5_NEPGR|nr:hypothetical protein Nepgr_008901 [Nepenthes gracilis]